MHEWRVRPFDELESTNGYLLGIARNETPGLVVVANHQTAGRGRLDRSWTTSKGEALTFSSLVEGQFALVATRAMALAIRDTCLELGGFEAQLKWPNDVLVGEAKLAGILAETSTDLDSVVLGCGLNVSGYPRIEGREVTDFSQHSSVEVSRESLLWTTLGYLDSWFGRMDAIGEEFARVCSTVGKMVRIERHGGVLEGPVQAVTNDGALIVDGTLVTVGDVISQRTLR
jgi:BirA family transcriptional regulator, biotin operon repressor / biotin---[acetyl-CoA-carboxylase] ligase